MSKLKDYSGKFQPNLRYEDFTQEALAKLLYDYARAQLRCDSGYTNENIVRHGLEIGNDTQYKVWEALAPEMFGWIINTLHIQGKDVSTFFKVLQMVPSFSPEFFDIKWELKSPQYGIFTVTRCKFLEEMEATKSGIEKLICVDSEPKTFQLLAKVINPNIVTTPLKLPPRKSKDEIACQFECRLEYKAPGK